MSATAARPRRRLTYFSATLALLFIGGVAARAQDASIDKLLKKLPPPESLVQRPPPIPRDELELLNDPLTTMVGTACDYRNWTAARSFAQRLTQAHPKNPWAHCILGGVEVQMTHFAEGAAAYHQALNARPNFPYAFLQLGVTEVIQQHFANAIPYFKKFVAQVPNEPIGWVFLSGCNEKTGHGKECLDYAKRGVATGPQFVGTWLQLAHAENAVGHTDNAKRALAQAQQLMRRR